jgi:hypothetical protein
VRFRLAHISDLHVLSPEGVHWRELFFNELVTGWANTRLRRWRVFRAGSNLYELEDGDVTGIEVHVLDSANGSLRRTEIPMRPTCL